MRAVQYFNFTLLLAIVATAAMPARAGLIASDSFESYTAGSQLESGADNSSGTGLNGGTGFTGAYNVDDAQKSKATVGAVALSYSNGAVSIDGGAQAAQVGLLGQTVASTNNLIMRPLPIQTDTFYFSFLMRTNQPTTAEDFLQIGFSDAATGEPKLSVGYSGASADTAPNYFFTRLGTGAGNQIMNTSFGAVQPDATYLLVGKVTSTGGAYKRIDLFVNPDSLTEPVTATVTKSNSGSTLAAVSNFTVRPFRFDLNDVVYIDELRVGTTYEDVVPAAVPEPATVGMLAAALLAGAALFLRRSTGR